MERNLCCGNYRAQKRSRVLQPPGTLPENPKKVSARDSRTGCVRGPIGRLLFDRPKIYTA